MQKALKIYVAGPYTAPDEAGCLANTLRAIDVAIKLMQMGHHPYVPHLTHFVDVRAKELGIEFTWQNYMDLDDVYLKTCDAFFYLAPSRGADIELSEAEKMGIPIYRSLDEVPAVG